MKNIRKSCLILLLATFSLTITPTQSEAAIPILEIIRQAVKKVIKAVDLKVQRLQNKTILLQNAQKVLENELSKLKLTEIAEWTEKHRKLYEKYYKELWEVKNAIATYQKIKRIIELQKSLVDEYKAAWSLVSKDENFTEDELNYIYQVYSGILEESVKNLDDILLVINPFKTQMSDGERLEVINRAGEKIIGNYSDLRIFNSQAVILSLNRAKHNHEVEVVRKLYGL